MGAHIPAYLIKLALDSPTRLSANTKILLDLIIHFQTLNDLNSSSKNNDNNDEKDESVVTVTDVKLKLTPGQVYQAVESSGQSTAQKVLFHNNLLVVQVLNAKHLILTMPNLP